MIQKFEEFINEAKQYNISYLEDLDKEYMGSDVWDYIDDTTGKCTLAEFIQAGKDWAEDMLSNAKFNDKEFDDAIEYYDNFGVKNKLK